ncbi:MAG: hypothetical protein Q9199_001010 [Rusavskia elegans]
MGNKISISTRQKRSTSLERDFTPALPSRNLSPPPARSSSISSSSSKTLRQQSTDTDGASSPKDEKCDMTLPAAPSLMTEAQCDQHTSPVTVHLEASFSALSAEDSIIYIIASEFLKPATVIRITVLAATSAFPNPI